MSPGISPHASGYRTAQKLGAKIMGELEFCFPYCRGKCISVTGTNGKTTVCEMIHKILSDCQMPNRLLGNGGVPFSSQVLETSTNEITVLESSSFQLYRCENFAPYVSVLTADCMFLNIYSRSYWLARKFRRVLQCKKEQFRSSNAGLCYIQFGRWTLRKIIEGQSRG